jgi:thiol-disulfide isomerase/thioredoxin
MSKRFSWIAVALVTLACGAGAADELSIGASAPRFSLISAADGGKVSFEPGNGKASVIIFTCNTCPYAKAFEDRMVALGAEYGGKGVQFFAVNPNDDVKYPGDSMELMKERTKTKQYSFPYLKDGDSSVARAYGARVTPHVFLVDGTGKVRYRGYIDDSAKPEERQDEGLRNALDDLLAKRDVKTASTRAFGCTIKWKSAT